MSTDFLHISPPATDQGAMTPLPPISTDVVAGNLPAQSPEISISEFLDIIGSFKANRGNFEQIVETLAKSNQPDVPSVIQAAEYVLKRKVEFSKLPAGEAMTEADCICIRIAVCGKWKDEMEALNLTLKNCLSHKETCPVPQMPEAMLCKAFENLKIISSFLLPAIIEELNKYALAREAVLQNQYATSHAELFCRDAGIARIESLDWNPLELDHFIRGIKGAEKESIDSLIISLQGVIERHSESSGTRAQNMRNQQISGSASVVLERIKSEFS